MYKDKSFLAIIPARGGSKRLPRKNIINLCGKPLIQWSIDAAIKSKYIDKVVVTTDDSEILDIVKNSAVEIIKRPSELATDTSTTFDAVQHTLEKIQEKYDFIVLLQPTSPLREYKHIDEAIELLYQKNADAVVSVTKTEHSPLWCNTLPTSNSMENFINEKIKNVRSQDLAEYYRLNGAIYVCKTKKLIEEKSFLIQKNIFAYKMDRVYSIDIDEKIDFDFARLILSCE